jgi:hypothetical protein
MLLQRDNPILESTAEIKSTAYTLDITAATFELLFKKLYKNPITSLIRELISNAHDSHVEAGSTKKIEVTAPTVLSSEFIVKDYGTGLSPENMVSIYSRGFKSTRNTDNKYLGAYGLGSKSPLAYTDQYLVETRWHGTRYQYLIFMNEENIPNLSEPLVTEPTDEPDGLTVTLSVRERDISEFTKATQQITSWFDNIDTNVERTPYKKVADYSHGALYEHNPNLGGPLLCRIGQVLYPLDLSQLEVSYYWAKSHKGHIIINIPIGLIDITPNREDLSYTERTKKALKDAIAQIKKESIDKLSWGIKLCRSENEAALKYGHTYKILDSLPAWGVPTLRFPGSEEPFQGNLHFPMPVNVKLYRIVGNRRALNKVNLTSMLVMNPAKKYHIYHAPLKTHYVKEWTSRKDLPTNEPTVAILGDNLQPLLAKLQNHNVVLHELDTSAYKKERERSQTTYKVVGSYTNSTLFPENYPFIYANGELIYETPEAEGISQYKFHDLLNTYRQYDSGFEGVILLPRSKWSKGKKLTNFFPYMRTTLIAAIETHKEELTLLRTLESIDKDIGFSLYYRLTEAGYNNALTELHVKYNKAKKHTMLLNALHSLNVIVNKDATLEKSINKTLTKYEAVLQNDIIKLIKLIDRS